MEMYPSIRSMTCALLTHGDKVLMLHRGAHKKIAPGMWSGVGGHIEQCEINDPMAACFREIKEETGIDTNDIKGLVLKYIALRHAESEIRITYFFIGELIRERPLIETDEGELSWIDMDNLSGLQMTFSVRQITEHWMNRLQSGHVMICTVNSANDLVQWSEL